MEAALLLLSHGQEHVHVAHQLLDWDKPSCLASGNQGRESEGYVALSAPAQVYRSIHPLSLALVCVLDRCPFLPGHKARKEAGLAGNIIFVAPESLHELQLTPHRGGYPLSPQGHSDLIEKALSSSSPL